MREAGTSFRGFTLIELMLAVTLVVIVFAIVGGAYSATLTTMNRMNQRERMVEQASYILRQMRDALAYTALLYSSTEGAGGAFIGKDLQLDDGTDADALQFSSSAPIQSFFGLRGSLKDVTYIASEVDATEVDARMAELKRTGTAVENSFYSPRLDLDNEGPQNRLMLTATEIPTLKSGGGSDMLPTDGTTGTGGTSSLLDFNYLGFNTDYNEESVEQLQFTWGIQLAGFNLTYYDGAEWMPDWDSTQLGCLPRAVHIELGFWREDDRYKPLSMGDKRKPVIFSTTVPMPPGQVSQVQQGNDGTVPGMSTFNP